MIIARELQKIYGHGPGATHALKDVDLTIRKGEFVAIMGRSGSGKSTLLHLLGLLDKPTTGEIIIDDLDVLELSDKEKARFRLEKLGYVFQEYSLIGELTALENVYLPSLCMNRNNGYKKYATELLDIVGLGERLTHYAGELSGGEQQRVAIARALINKPGIFFADEPTASLDAESALTVLKLFKTLNKELKQTIVMVTHEPDDEVYVDRVIRLNNGFVDEQL
jgi:putative ABC transport system ATP-binding protein